MATITAAICGNCGNRGYIPGYDASEFEPACPAEPCFECDRGLLTALDNRGLFALSITDLLAEGVSADRVEALL